MQHKLQSQVWAVLKGGLVSWACWEVWLPGSRLLCQTWIPGVSKAVSLCSGLPEVKAL